jgi:hypothetical protein
VSDTGVDAQIADRLRAVAPDVTAIEVLRRSAKGVVLAGSHAGMPVVAKLLTSRTPFWQQRFAAEITAYEAMAMAPPPVPAPKLIAAVPEAGVLITTRLPGTPVAVDRYPSALTAARAAPLVDALWALSRWTMTAESFAPVWDYPERLNRYRDEYGLLTGRETGQLNALLTVAAPMQPAHGDLLPANVLHAYGQVTGSWIGSSPACTCHIWTPPCCGCCSGTCPRCAVVWKSCQGRR